MPKWERGILFIHQNPLQIQMPNPKAILWTDEWRQQQKDFIIDENGKMREKEGPKVEVEWNK